MNVAQGGVYSDTTAPIRTLAGAIVIDGIGAGTVTLVALRDTDDVDRSSGASLTYAGDGCYRVTKAIPTDGALGMWRVIVRYAEGALPARDFSDTFQVETAAQADPLAAVGLTSALVDNLAFIRPGAVTVSSAVTEDLDIVRGDTFSRPIHLLDQDGEDFDLTGGKAWLTVKRKRDARDDDTDAVIQLYWESGGSSSGITASDEAGGVLVIEMTPSQTDLLHHGTDYRYDVQAENGSQVGTPIRGNVVVLQDSTRRRTVP